jgi:hypothetical protein
MKTFRSPIQAEPEYTTTQIAHHYGVGEATIRRWHRDGMPAKAYTSRLFRYRLSEVQKWLDERAAKNAVA